MKSKLVCAMIISFSFLAPAYGQEIAEGVNNFNANCAVCHGDNGQGSQTGPSLLMRVNSESDEDLLAFLRIGNPEKGMPPVTLSDEEIPSLIAYLRFLAGSAGLSGFSNEKIENRFASITEIENFNPITEQELLNPSPNDWLWYSRTADAQRHSPLDQINTNNVGQLTLAWTRGLPEGLTETIPTVSQGIMYLTMPDSSVAALDATTGDMIWQYSREYSGGRSSATGRSKTLSIFADMVYFTAPDSTVIALDAVTGELRWEAEVGNRGNSSGSIVVEGKVLSGGTCNRGRENCYISAHDAYTGELLWKFYTTQAPDEPPGFDTWGGAPVESRSASTWGLPGGYDAETGLIYWGIANPTPNTRSQRHAGDPHAVSYSAPSDLYSNSTVAIHPDTGELAWYYQHLPGDDWDEDINQERIILTTPINPDPAHVRWINPNIPKGEVRDVIVNIGEGGGIWVLDKYSGEFIWASPFPEDVENFILSDIDVETGITHINQALVLDEPGERQVICFFNTRSYWPTSYFPEKNSLYVPYIRNCLDMTSAKPSTPNSPATPESRVGITQEGISEEELNGLAKINMESGEVTHWPMGAIPTNSAMLTTAGNLIFWGDINRRYRAMNADTGEELWQTILGGPISVSNITYAVDGRQYVAVITGNNLSHPGISTGTMGPIRLNFETGTSNNIYIFALPE